MSFTKIKSKQTTFLESYLRGTNRTLSAAQARALFGIQNLRARICDLRTAGLRIRKDTNTMGRTVYAVSRRDEFGDQFKIFK